MGISLRERNRLAAMERVRLVACDLMAANGFDAVTVEQIAARSSVSPSTVYRYFGTKEALVLSSDRAADMIDRLRRDESARGPSEALQRAAVKEWAGDDAAFVELGLATTNATLLQGFERQLLDHRSALATTFAERRGATSPGARDTAHAAASIAILMSTLVAWHQAGGGKKALDKALTKGFSVLKE
jgi:AcrR family transcriptional regulator